MRPSRRRLTPCSPVSERVGAALAILGACALAASTLIAAPTASQSVVLVVEPLLNTVDGSEILGCIERAILDSRRNHQTWIAFGVVKSRAAGWEPVASRIDCGTGPFDKTGIGVVRTFGTPYLIVDIESKTSARPVEASLRIRKLTGFDQNGSPMYLSSITTRTVDPAIVDSTIVPLLIGSPQERDAFAMHELFLRLTARVSAPVSYGSVSVTADVPGIRIFLDGGLVGRTTEGGPAVFGNVLTGKRELLVRDFSGREASTTVMVARGSTTTVALAVLKLSDKSRAELEPIGKNPEGYEEYWRRRDGAVVVNVPAGEFLMGSPDGQGEANERPQHQVDVSSFLIDKTEVTWRQFRKFAAATEAGIPPAPLWGTPDDYPVVNVLWSEAKAFCEWVGGSLPTEAQWEKAARGTDGRLYPWGNDWDRDRCNSIDGGTHRPEAVGAFPNCTTPSGVVDMAGSAWEWVADRYAVYAADPAMRDAQGPATGGMRVLRGGSWLSQPTLLRTAYRSRNDPGARNVHHGFRCAQTPLN